MEDGFLVQNHPADMALGGSSGGLGKLGGGNIGAGSRLSNVNDVVPFQARLLSPSCSEEGPGRGTVWPNDGLP